MRDKLRSRRLLLTTAINSDDVTRFAVIYLNIVYLLIVNEKSTSVCSYVRAFYMHYDKKKKKEVRISSLILCSSVTE
jgi:hypothetical protein